MLCGRALQAGLTDAPALARQLLLPIEGASVIASIEGTGSAGQDARRAAEALIRGHLPTGGWEGAELGLSLTWTRRSGGRNRVSRPVGRVLISQIRDLGSTPPHVP